ncbi:BON domain-containing protein [Veronia pacifica]|uniref:Hemolysin n=1 Tax=Veronia pacifica TaxID=1080227 RepID=A0A1C3ELK3_9GAMM|nr:BON domain-containing protein [Veronia pacifica]ODA34100.1 hemolysin [Veronia pacifica]
MRLHLVFLIVLATLSGCSAIYTKDTRSSSIEWNDSKVVIGIAGIVNKAPFKGQIRANAVSYEGNVLIVGQAVNDEIRQQFIAKVKKLNNVGQVFDKLRVRPLLTLQEISKDTWITTKVKSSLIASKKLNDIYIQVLTEDGEVFLMGYVSNQQADMATEIARNISGVKRVIKGFNYVEDSATSED